MTDPQHAAAVRLLAARASTHVGRARISWINRCRVLVYRSSHGRWGRPRPQNVPDLGTPWQDVLSLERGSEGWRQRSAHLDGEEVFGVDYLICRRCGLGWVEQPYTREDCQRLGLATAALAALREEHPGLSWHTLGGHYAAPQFWDAVGADVDGGYQRRDLCRCLPMPFP